MSVTQRQFRMLDPKVNLWRRFLGSFETTSAAGQNYGHVLGDEAPGRQGATSAHSRSYVNEEQRSRPGWIGSQNMAGILTGGTRRSVIGSTAERFRIFVDPSG